MWSIEPDSSPIAHICSTMDGNTFALVMATVRLVPVETSCWIFCVAISYTELPEAPPTESSASTSGTPAANMVDRVRVQRAIAAFLSSGPKIGALRLSLSMKICTASERFQASRKPYTAPPIAGKTMYQFATVQSEMPMMMSVGVGRSAPKLENTLLNAGITKIMITAVITIATTTIDTG